MAHQEAQRWQAGDKTADFYKAAMRAALEAKARDERLIKVVKPEDMPWEDTPQGRIKWVINERMDVRIKTLDIFIQELPPGGYSGRHRHMSEEFVFILEGRGHDLHWDMDALIRDKYDWRVSDIFTRWDWEPGDAICIPVNTVHQHCNDDPRQPARFISATNRVYGVLGYPDLEQLETVPPEQAASTSPGSSAKEEASWRKAWELARARPGYPVAATRAWMDQMEELERIRGLPRVIKAKDTTLAPAAHVGDITHRKSSAAGFPDDTVPLATFKCWLSAVVPPQGDENIRGHSHQFEAVFYILDGEGYEIHDAIKYPWRAGDAVIVHPSCVHGHFSTVPSSLALVITSKPMYQAVNLREEQLRLP